MKPVPVICTVASALVLAPLAIGDAVRDPTRPPLNATMSLVTREAAPVLSAVLGTGNERIAIFNGQLVRGGGSVGAYVIETVFEDGVRYRRAGVTHELYLRHPPAFKKPSTLPARSPAGVH